MPPHLPHSPLILTLPSACRDKYGDARPRVEDAPLPASFNIFQLAGELAKKRSRPAAEADKGEGAGWGQGWRSCGARDKMGAAVVMHRHSGVFRATAGSPKKRKKRVRFSEKLEIAADGGGAGSKAAGSEPAAAQTGGKLAAAPVAAPVGALAAAAEKQRKGKAGSGGSKKWAGKSQKKKKGSGSTRVPRAQSVLSRMNGRSGGKKAGKGKQGRG